MAGTGTSEAPRRIDGGILLGLIVTAGIFAAIGGAAVYSSIPSAAEKAERHYAFLDRNGASRRELCTAARQVEAAYAEARDDEHYRSWRLNADVDCQSADLQERY